MTPTNFPATALPMQALTPSTALQRSAGSLTNWFYQLAEAAVNGAAYRLAWHDGAEYQMSRAFLAHEAAETAAPSLNRARAGRGLEIYTHIITFVGDEPIQVVRLEVA